MIKLLGYNAGVGAKDIGCEDGPVHFKNYISSSNDRFFWQKFIHPSKHDDDKYKIIKDLSEELANESYRIIKNKQTFITIGGDHSCAIGTWSGVAEALKDDGDMGLIWVDAHMDSHTPETTESGNIHGMPLASLMGYGDSRLKSILSPFIKLKPQNLCLIGIRSYEKGEAELLARLGVKIYFMSDVKKLGMPAIMHEAIKLVSRHTVRYGVSIDLDAMDPKYITGVGTPEEDGIMPEDLLNSISLLRANPPIAYEIGEYNPHHDENNNTAKFMLDILNAIFLTHQQ